MDEIKGILVLKPLKQSLLQNETSFSLPERICRISSAILNTKMKHTNVGPSTRLQEGNPVNAQNASLKRVLLVFYVFGPPGDKHYVILSPSLKCYLRVTYCNPERQKTNPFPKHVVIIILDIFICLEKTLVLETMHCILIIFNPLPTVYKTTMKELNGSLS